MGMTEIYVLEKPSVPFKIRVVRTQDTKMLGLGRTPKRMS